MHRYSRDRLIKRDESAMLLALVHDSGDPYLSDAYDIQSRKPPSRKVFWLLLAVSPCADAERRLRCRRYILIIWPRPSAQWIISILTGPLLHRISGPAQLLVCRLLRLEGYCHALRRTTSRRGNSVFFKAC
ncbi:hypothetical protein BG74_07900 [Sodalis-like endosymbiont of Proechinophthirus fluctus]|nr:hypothetical protein BG74_07900 [Sodalis-like endosymbiont of Proechinophthirus fluctus]